MQIRTFRRNGLFIPKLFRPKWKSKDVLDYNKEYSPGVLLGKLRTKQKTFINLNCKFA